MQGIQDIHRVSDQYKLVSSKWKLGHTSIDFDNKVKIGNNNFEIMAGPCSIENENQIINTIEHLKAKTHLPVIVDPSHGIGIRKFVEPMALAGIMAGADGLIIEVHQEPEKAISDGQQSLNFDEAETMYKNVNLVLETRRKLYH